MKFQLLIKTKMLKNKNFSCFIKLSDAVFILLINVKTIVGILTFMCGIKFMLSWVEYEKGAWRHNEDILIFGKVKLFCVNH